MVEKQKQSTLKPEGWETLDIKMKYFLCFIPIMGSDERACEAVAAATKDMFGGKKLSRRTVFRWRQKHPHFGRIEQELKNNEITLTRSMIGDLNLFAAVRMGKALESDDARTIVSAAQTVWKASGIIAPEQKQGGGKVVVIMPAVFAEKEKIAGRTDYRLIEGVRSPLGTGMGTQVEQEDQGYELGEEVGEGDSGEV